MTDVALSATAVDKQEMAYHCQEKHSHSSGHCLEHNPPQKTLLGRSTSF